MGTVSLLSFLLSSPPFLVLHVHRPSVLPAKHCSHMPAAPVRRCRCRRRSPPLCRFSAKLPSISLTHPSLLCRLAQNSLFIPPPVSGPSCATITTSNRRQTITSNPPSPSHAELSSAHYPLPVPTSYHRNQSPSVVPTPNLQNTISSLYPPLLRSSTRPLSTFCNSEPPPPVPIAARTARFPSTSVKLHRPSTVSLVGHHLQPQTQTLLRPPPLDPNLPVPQPPSSSIAFPTHVPLSANSSSPQPTISILLFPLQIRIHFNPNHEVHCHPPLPISFAAVRSSYHRCSIPSSATDPTLSTRLPLLSLSPSLVFPSSSRNPTAARRLLHRRVP